MRVMVLGAGLIGTTAAYELMRRGHEVVVVDRQPGPATECSFANGGQLSYSHAEPWASPRMLPKIFKWLGHEDAPLIVRLRADPAMWRWMLSFLRHCTPEKNHEGTKNALKLSLFSRDCMRRLREETNIEFQFADTGTLHIYRDQASLDNAVKHAEFQKTFGCDYTFLDPASLIAKEPALQEIRHTLAGGLHFPLDEVGDACQFTTALADYCKNVEFRYHTDIQRLEHDGSRITGIATPGGTLRADAYVVALGAYSPLLLKPLGIRLPIYPIKGYSLSLPLSGQPYSLHTSILDEVRKIVATRLGETLRIAGTAEFTGYDHSLNARRIEALHRAAQELFPSFTGWENASKWACLRPSTPSGAPILGKTSYRNLYLNTGHGSLGWTFAAGSASIVADAVEAG